MNFVMNLMHAPGSRWIARPVDQQSRALPLCYGRPLISYIRIYMCVPINVSTQNVHSYVSNHYSRLQVSRNLTLAIQVKFNYRCSSDTQAYCLYLVFRNQYHTRKEIYASCQFGKVQALQFGIGARTPKNGYPLHNSCPKSCLLAGATPFMSVNRLVLCFLIALLFISFLSMVLSLIVFRTGFLFSHVTDKPQNVELFTHIIVKIEDRHSVKNSEYEKSHYPFIDMHIVFQL